MPTSIILMLLRKSDHGKYFKWQNSRHQPNNNQRLELKTSLTSICNISWYLEQYKCLYKWQRERSQCNIHNALAVKVSNEHKRIRQPLIHLEQQLQSEVPELPYLHDCICYRIRVPVHSQYSESTGTLPPTNKELTADSMLISFSIFAGKTMIII